QRPSSRAASWTSTGSASAAPAARRADRPDGLIGVSWWSELGRRLRGEPEPVPVPELPPAPTREEILASVEDVRRRVAGRVAPSVQARVEGVARTVGEAGPGLDPTGRGSRQAPPGRAAQHSAAPEQGAGEPA